MRVAWAAGAVCGRVMAQSHGTCAAWVACTDKRNWYCGACVGGLGGRLGGLGGRLRSLCGQLCSLRGL